jgi:imidazolonepropionase-like amidohydrolase
VTADARRALMAGFTSVREMGGMGTFLGRAIDEGQVTGPTVYASGSMLSMTAGHGGRARYGSRLRPCFDGQAMG